MIKLTKSLFGQMIGWSIVLVLLFATNSQAISYEKNVFDQQVFIGDFNGDTASFTTIIERDSHDDQIIERGEFSDSYVTSIPLFLQLEGETKLYFPAGMEIPDSETYMLIVYNLPFDEGNPETHIFRFENNVINQHFVLPGDLNQSARVFYLDNEVYFGFQKSDTYVITHYDLDTNELTEIFDLQVHLDVVNYVFTQDVDAYADKIFLSGGFLTLDGDDWIDETYLLELTPHGNNPVDIEQYQYSSGFQVLDIEPVANGVWRASRYGSYPDHIFWLDFITIGDSVKYQFEGLNVYDLEVLSPTEFVVNEEGSMIEFLSIEDGELINSWGMEVGGQIISMKAFDNSIATSLVDGQGNIILRIYNIEINSEDDATLKIPFPSGLVVPTLLILIVGRVLRKKKNRMQR
ncbi:MAG: hypothetical protein ACXAD7_21655 [Candidatus Kariarchaeaceae archaeon]|jgi:hypothetical protein